MRKIPFLFLTVAVCLSAAGAALAGELSPNMEAYLAQKADAEPVHGLIIMKDRLDIKALDYQLHEARASFDERHVTVITALMEDAERAQASLLADLEVRRQLGEIDSYEPFWIINGVYVIAKDEAPIRDLALRNDVEIVEAPLAIELIKPASQVEPDKDGTAIGITPGVVNVGARRVWSELGITGAGAIVANLDTGVDGNHPALAANWRGNFAPAEECWLDFVGGFNVPPQDSDIHGTHTMGTMCGLAPNDTIGVAPGAHWIAANTIVGGSLNSQVLQTLQWLADPDGDPMTTDDVPDVANNSWGVYEAFGYPDCYNGWWAAIDACEAAGVVHVWATGNEGPGGSTVRSPADRASTPHDSFSVGATNYYAPYNIAGFSSRGPAGPTCGPAENLIKPEVVAPGNNIYSSIPNGGYMYMGGTSMATPHVAGVVALMRSANPDLDVITIKQILMDTADDLGVVGEDNTYGWGFLDAFEAVSAATAGYGTLVGTVVDDATGLPIEGAVVAVVDAFPSDVTDETGAFRLVLPAGPTQLAVSAFGFELLEETVEVPAGAEIQPELRMVPQPAVTLAGTIYGPGDAFPGGTPAAGAVVTVADTPLSSVVTGADGSWSVDVPADVEYTVRAALPGLGSVVQTLPAQADLDCDLYLRASVEDGFESGDFGSFPWVFAGDAEWTITDEDASEGAYAARSGEIYASQTSILRLDIDIVEDGELSFWFRTQGGSSTFSFWDGFATIESWDGVPDWTFYSYPVTAGEHTFRWRVSTTSGGGAGDLAFVDHIVFPGGDAAAPRAVPCPGGVSVEVDVNGTAASELLVLNEGVEDLNWTLSDALPSVAVDNTGGTLAPAGYAVVGLSVDATGLAEGNHVFNLTLASNDPDNPSIVVPVTVMVGTVLPVEDTPTAFELVGAVPNPFNPMTTVHFSLPATQSARLNVYDVQGRLVRQLLDEVRPAGANQVNWDGRDQSGRGVASGTYFARLVSGGQTSVKAMVLVR
jgi:subtilisin family serine protease